VETIDFDLPCARCGYNLRTLPREGMCPECGEYVGPSLAAHAAHHAASGRLAALSPQQRDAMSDAVWLVGASWLFGLMTAAIPADALHARIDNAAGIFVLLPMSACFVLGCWAARRASFGLPASQATVGCRWLPIAVLAGCACEHLNDSWIRAWLPFALARDVRVVNASQIVTALGNLMAFANWVVIGLSFTLFARASGYAGRRGLRAFFAAAGIASVLLAVFVIALSSGAFTSSRETMMARVSPVGTTPLTGAVLRAIVSDPGTPDACGGAILAAIFGVQFGLPFALFGLHLQITRAIQLGGLPAANSRS
jgi:hypothetical protein